MTTPIFPFVHVRGSWGEMGRDVGRMFAPLIERHVDAWTEHVVQESGARREAVEAAAARFGPAIERHAPFLWEELDGLAGGSGLPVSRLMVLQARAEVLRALKSAPAPADSLECTTFAVGGARTGGAVLFGQNIDLVPFLEPFGVVVRQAPSAAPAALLFTTAGLLGHNGLNEAGVGVCANFIDDPAGWGDGLPRYLLSRLALRADSAAGALAAVLAPPRAASRNMLFADVGGTFLDAELLRTRHAVLHGTEGLLVHANHVESPELEGVAAPTENSRCRRARLTELLEKAPGAVTVEYVRQCYRDHAGAPHSLCAHPFPGRHVSTVASMIGDLTARELHLTRGAPCRARYATYTLATCADGAVSVSVRDTFIPAA
ncbi:MAG: C45 family autoproteolytic acyltransferase/hydrolase [Candidatus Rokubacteria bacterium]|nr:C45 family autoproteolytic acyltransferase/hydrolase [Candidatus Rokubacteria bacterium]